MLMRCFFTRLICAEDVTNKHLSGRETAFAVFSSGSSNVNVLGMEELKWQRK